MKTELPFPSTHSPTSFSQRSNARVYLPHITVGILFVLEILLLVHKGLPNLSIPHLSSDSRPSQPRPCRSRPRVAQVIDLNPNLPNYEDILTNHHQYANKHRYPIHTLTHSSKIECSSKAIQLTAILMEELTKPTTEQVEWLLWTSDNAVFLNSELPIETFLPPTTDPAYKHINLLVSKDSNELNTDVFLMRVSHWSLNLVIATLQSSPFFPSDSPITNCEHFFPITLSHLLNTTTAHHQHMVLTPRRWFSSPASDMTLDSLLVTLPTPSDSDSDTLTDDYLTVAQSMSSSRHDLHPHGLAVTSWSEDAEWFWYVWRQNRVTVDDLRHGMLPESVRTVGYERAVDALEEVFWFAAEDGDMVMDAMGEVERELSWLKGS